MHYLVSYAITKHHTALIFLFIPLSPTKHALFPYSKAKNFLADSRNYRRAQSIQPNGRTVNRQQDTDIFERRHPNHPPRSAFCNISPSVCLHERALCNHGSNETYTSNAHKKLNNIAPGGEQTIDEIQNKIRAACGKGRDGTGDDRAIFHSRPRFPDLSRVAGLTSPRFPSRRSMNYSRPTLFLRHYLPMLDVSTISPVPRPTTCPFTLHPMPGWL